MQQQFVDHLMNSPKPSNIFANNKTFVNVQSSHFIYEYLFVQVSEAHYYRDYFPKLKLSERFCDTRSAVGKEIDVKTDERGIKDKL